MEELIRPSRPEEIPEVVRIVNSVFRPGNRGVPMEVAFGHFLCEENAEQIYLVEKGKRIVSVLGTLPSRIVIEGAELPVVSIGSVCTLPEERGRGFATRMLEWLHPRLKEQGIALMLVSGTRGLYRRQGCLEVGESYEMSVTAWSPAGLDAGSDFGVYDDRRLAQLLAVYNREPVRFVRSAEGFAVLLRNQSYLSYLQARVAVFVHETAGAIDAYAVAGARSRDGVEIGEVTEFAGPDEAVVGLLAFLAKRLGLSRLSVSIPGYRRPLVDSLASIGFSLRTEPIPGTIKVIELPALWSSLGPYLDARLSPAPPAKPELVREGGGYLLSLGPERIFLDESGATRLLFNGPQLSSPSPLKAALSRAFPLPFVYTNNLNFI